MRMVVMTNMAICPVSVNPVYFPVNSISVMSVQMTFVAKKIVLLIFTI